ncbi:14445_t:CDS:2 [Funneliformis mosseae]|uniref:14445_t:CDS:1 n=1 Tax=Funneliformis mosseae TaxID=27381 RepID=A0A9N9DSE9_FUNMO|nr:14445_t:CDS:2 [Funneliformis mosseae]
MQGIREIALANIVGNVNEVLWLVFVDDSRPYKVKAKKELDDSIKIIKNMLLLRSDGEEGIDNTEYGSFWCC